MSASIAAVPCRAAHRLHKSSREISDRLVSSDTDGECVYSGGNIAFSRCAVVLEWGPHVRNSSAGGERNRSDADKGTRIPSTPEKYTATSLSMCF